MTKVVVFVVVLALLLPAWACAQRQMERLGRGVVAVRQADGRVWVGWRLLGTDPDSLAFNLYRSTVGGRAVKLNDKPLEGPTDFIDAKADLTKSNSYFVRPVLKGKEEEPSAAFTLAAHAPARQYLSIPLQTPQGYSPNDASAGDLDGDGEYELVVHMTGRGLCLDIDPRHEGFECWVRGAGVEGLFDARGEVISQRVPRSCNFGVYWDGDALSELLDRNYISKWNWTDATETVLLTAEGCVSNNGTKATPALSADLFGDWREEVVWRTADNRELRVYTTTIPTALRFYTFMHDPQYRLSVAWQNVAYNQPPHTSFFVGEGMRRPPRPNIVEVRAKR